MGRALLFLDRAFGRAGGNGRVEARAPAQRGASGALADRMAAALVHREPGWQLPRRSALARRYNVSMAEIDVAIGESPAGR